MSSAEEIVPFVLHAIGPRSVIDLGCGIGAWLTAFRRAGVELTVGVDAAYHPHTYQISAETFVAHDLTKPLAMPPHLPSRFDLAVSLEVAEHLPPACAATFIRTLTGLAPTVMFSAAVPYQGGRGHVNEQWPNYWATLFAEQNYLTVDYLRNRVWSNARVAFYYAQNVLLFVERAHFHHFPQLSPFVVDPDDGVLSRIHPDKWIATNSRQRRPWRRALRIVPLIVRRAIRARPW